MKDISRNIEYKKNNYWRYPMSREKLYMKLIQAIPNTLTRNLRILPDFLIIGGQKCGTSSIYFNLRKHSQVSPALTKEVHFFDNNYEKGIGWYRKHFPTEYYRKISEKFLNKNIITGEASPDYICGYHVPERVYNTLPDVKILAFLRNPVDRAYSHYQHYLRQGLENLSFEEALGNEHKRLEGELEKIKADPDYFSFNYQHYSYKKRGLYAEQIKRWMEFFTRDQFLILRIEDYYSDPASFYRKILDFLGLPEWIPRDFRKYNVGKKYEKMKEDTRKELIEYFRPHNKELYELLGKDFNWDI